MAIIAIINSLSKLDHSVGRLIALMLLGVSGGVYFLDDLGDDV